MSKNEQPQSEYLGLITPSDVELQCNADAGGCGVRFWQSYDTIALECVQCGTSAFVRRTGRIMASMQQTENKVSRGQGKRGKVAFATRRDADTETIYKLLCDIPA